MTLEDILEGSYLWPHQINAIVNSRNYIQAWQNQRINSKGALNRLPTGTGKSGIITMLSRCYLDCKKVLIVVPSQTLREQLVADISYDFFKSIGLIDQPFTKEVITFVPSNLEAKLVKIKQIDAVLITTIQSLYEIYRDKENSKLFENLAEEIDLVIFDEGHREPAPEWADAVRAIPKPRILFTATPYRNDRLQFDIDPSFVYSYTHEEAVSGNYIRNIEFRKLPLACRDTKIFCEELVSFYRNELLTIKPSNVTIPRVIIRCDNFSLITEIAGHISDLGYKVIGIHERFDTTLSAENSSDNVKFIKHVPNLKAQRKSYIDQSNDEGTNTFESELPIFWIHQFKLLEGIDEFSFCVVANFSPMNNARMMIQQVGRILRNRNQQRNTMGYVLTQQGSPDQKFWEGYLKFEKNYEDISAMNTLYYQEIYESILNVMPVYHYEDKDFKRRFDWHLTVTEEENDLGEQALEYYNHFNYKLNCQIYNNDGVLTLDELEKGIKDNLLTNEYNLRKESAERPENGVLFFPYVKTSESLVLLDLYFLNYIPGYVVCCLTKKYLFYYDSSGSSSDFINSKYSPLHPEILKKLFPREKSTIKSITLRSTDMGNHTIRRQQIISSSLNNTVADLVDYLNFYSTATGKSDLSTIQTYVGFTKSRVSDHSSRKTTYKEYRTWLINLENILNSNTHATPFFNRYADFTSPPKKTKPLNILIDFDEISGEFRHKTSKDLLSYELTCYDIKNRTFDLELGSTSQKYKIHIVYDVTKKKYILECNQLKIDYQYYTKDGTFKAKENIISYLNREQCFRIIPQQSGIIYAHHQFYQPKLAISNFKKQPGIELFSIFIADPTFKNIGSEKGRACTQTGWEKGSLFELVDNLGKGTLLHDQLRNLDYLICDDAGNTEIADFIGLQISPPRVIMMHCKAFNKARKRSASALQEVSAQAVKNLSYLVLTNIDLPPNSKYWEINNSWSASGTTGKLNRLRYSKKTRGGSCEPGEILKKWTELIQNPSTSKEVYLLLGKGFEIEAFKKNLDSSTPDPVNFQIAYLVQSTWSNIVKVASKFLIFCN